MVGAFAGLRGYQRAWWQGDLLAGITVAAFLVPQVMAYAQVAGVPPVAGLWAALPALVVYAALGSSRSLSMGPESTTALMTAVAIGPLAAGNPVRYAGLAASLALLVGVLSACQLGERRAAVQLKCRATAPGFPYAWPSSGAMAAPGRWRAGPSTHDRG